MPSSADSKDILLALHLENSRQARHHEQQRQLATAFVAVATAIVLASLAGSTTAPPACEAILLLDAMFLCVAGGFGFLASLRHHERSRLHVQRVHAIRDELTSRFAVDILALYGAATEEHERRFAQLSRRTARVHYLWQAFHTGVVTAGLGLAALALL